MKNQNKPVTGGGKQGNDPYKNDPTKQDEGDNDATRIQPEKGKTEIPQNPPGGQKNKRNKGIEEPEKQPPYKRTPGHKPEQPVEEPEKQEGSEINKGTYNPANTENRQESIQEKDNEGNAVVKGYGKGL